MPGKIFLDYLESNIDLDVKTQEKFTPDNSENIFNQTEVDPIELYYWSKKGIITDNDLKNKLGTIEINDKIKNNIKERIKKEIKGQSAEEGVYLREFLYGRH